MLILMNFLLNTHTHAIEYRW